MAHRTPTQCAAERRALAQAQDRADADWQAVRNAIDRRRADTALVALDEAVGQLIGDTARPATIAATLRLAAHLDRRAHAQRHAEQPLVCCREPWTGSAWQGPPPVAVVVGDPRT